MKGGEGGQIQRVFVEERMGGKHRRRNIIDLNERECVYKTMLNIDVFTEQVILDMTDIPFLQK